MLQAELNACGVAELALPLIRPTAGRQAPAPAGKEPEWEPAVSTFKDRRGAVRGDCDVNEAKVGHHLNCRERDPASPMKPCAAGRHPPAGA